MTFALMITTVRELMEVDPLGGNWDCGPVIEHGVGHKDRGNKAIGAHDGGLITDGTGTLSMSN